MLHLAAIAARSIQGLKATQFSRILLPARLQHPSMRARKFGLASCKALGNRASIPDGALALRRFRRPRRLRGVLRLEPRAGRCGARDERSSVLEGRRASRRPRDRRRDSRGRGRDDRRLERDRRLRPDPAVVGRRGRTGGRTSRRRFYRALRRSDCRGSAADHDLRIGHPSVQGRI